MPNLGDRQEWRKMEDTKIQWHAAFVSAMDLELAQNRPVQNWDRSILYARRVLASSLF